MHPYYRRPSGSEVAKNCVFVLDQSPLVIINGDPANGKLLILCRVEESDVRVRTVSKDVGVDPHLINLVAVRDRSNVCVWDLREICEVGRVSPVALPANSVFLTLEVQVFGMHALELV